MIDKDIFFMKKALIEAKKAEDEDEVPVGAIIVYDDKIIAKAHNMCVKLCDPTAHAEMQAITAACNYLDSRYLENCIMYTTLEPCVMCSGYILQSRLNYLYFGLEDKKMGSVENGLKVFYNENVKTDLEIFFGFHF